MVGFLTEIAWETDVWVAEDATHLIHFNGQHLLQLYKSGKIENASLANKNGNTMEQKVDYKN
ncbi:BsuBI/PstI family type II restriction endonuclease [Planktothrix pseudagardhii]|uniref:Type-2 restriction enzyme BsuBI n=1 Tax=Planktothrix pseudagardhii TaxID=132604 RepID=A0A9W4CGB1_9CYAN|nr:BsuBI/PstI family type II restriction endonuclease [Planktothrix pseudagardhii]CAD5927209.1 Type-2 restriction enzyme BsuBI [Planktothrix pseudagardhii]